MNIITQIHRQAMELTDQAYQAKALGQADTATDFFYQAFEAERRAAEMIATRFDAEPTRSVLHRSAATLALNCGQYREAERLVCIALSGTPPTVIAEELRDLLEQIYFTRHLEVKGVTLSPEDVQMSVAGKAVGLGVAPSDEIINRIQSTEKMIIRTAERKQGEPFRDKGPVRRALRDDYNLFVSVPRAASFAVTFKLGLKDQPRLPYFDDANEIIDELLICLDLYTSSQEDALRRRIENEAYYNNFVGLASRIEPDGTNIDLVGFTASRDGAQRSVSLTRRDGQGEKHTRVPLANNRRPRSPQSRSIQIIGQLLFADSRNPSSGQIKVVGEDGVEYRVVVPEGIMGDVVKPLWEDTVIVTGRSGRYGHIILEDIQNASDSPLAEQTDTELAA